MEIYLYSVMSMGAIAALLALGLGVASKVFRVSRDQRIEAIEELLPAVNCGACGYAGCGNFAEAVVKGEAGVNGCPVGGDEIATRIAEIMETDSEGTARQVARLLCKGGFKHTAKKGKYAGIKTCQAVALINGGTKCCSYGCLSYGDCAAVCPFGAIIMSEEGLPVIIEEKCTACGRCVEACPQHILILASVSVKNDISCHSTAPGKIVNKICEVGCIGCGLCVKVCPVTAIELRDNLAVLDYDKCINCGLCSEKCPTGTIEFQGRLIEEIEITDKCVGCTRCVRECPVEAISGEVKQKHEIDPEKCVKCGLCAEVCKVKGAIFWR